MGRSDQGRGDRGEKNERLELTKLKECRVYRGVCISSVKEGEEEKQCGRSIHRKDGGESKQARVQRHGRNDAMEEHQSGKESTMCGETCRRKCRRSAGEVQSGGMEEEEHAKEEVSHRSGEWSRESKKSTSNMK